MVVPTHPDIERIVLVTVDCLRWDFHQGYRDLYPNGVWYRATPNATWTAESHTSLFTGLPSLRHGVHSFGQRLQTDHIFGALDSISTSILTNPEMNGVDMDVRHRTVSIGDFLPDSFDRNGWRNSVDRLREILDDDPDLLWLHDWLVHDCGVEGMHQSWVRTIHEDASVAENREAYDYHVDADLQAHERLLEVFKEEEKFDDTLFIVWGDHGQGLGEPPLEPFTHAGIVSEYTARVPIGFCSPLFDSMDDDVDNWTNPRGMDVFDTIRSIAQDAGMPWYGVSHETEGVDLTEFRGSLAGYVTSRGTYQTGGIDGIKMADYSLIHDGDDLVMLRSDPNSDGLSEEIVESDPRRDHLEEMYADARDVRSPTDLVVAEEPTDFLRDMGYL